MYSKYIRTGLDLCLPFAVLLLAAGGVSRGREPGKKFASKNDHSTRGGREGRRELEREGEEDRQEKSRKEGVRKRKAAMISVRELPYMISELKRERALNLLTIC